jgi:hypothetical protein
MSFGTDVRQCSLWQAVGTGQCSGWRALFDRAQGRFISWWAAYTSRSFGIAAEEDRRMR